MATTERRWNCSCAEGFCAPLGNCASTLGDVTRIGFFPRSELVLSLLSGDGLELAILSVRFENRKLP